MADSAMYVSLMLCRLVLRPVSLFAVLTNMFSTKSGSGTVTSFVKDKPAGRTFALQDQLPRLPIPSLEDTCRRYLQALVGLQDTREQEATKAAVEEFLEGEGPRIHQKLIEWAKDKARCVMVLIIGSLDVYFDTQLH
jgi:hypothetical protein